MQRSIVAADALPASKVTVKKVPAMQLVTATRVKGDILVLPPAARRACVAHLTIDMHRHLVRHLKALYAKQTDSVLEGHLGSAAQGGGATM